LLRGEHGGALVGTRPEIARELKKPLVRVIGAGEAVKGQSGGTLDLTRSASAWSGAAAFRWARRHPLRLDLRQLHDHRARAARRPRLLRQGPRRTLRRGRRPRLPDEGVSMLTNLVDSDFDRLKIGAPVRVVFRSAAGGEATPMFTPL
jgi:hypothetical protein